MKNFEYLHLMDIYGELLTQRQRGMVADYYERDYSLSEIAENYGISRQGVHAAIKQAEESLSEYEQKLHLRRFLTELNRTLFDWEHRGADTDAIRRLQEYIRSNYGTVR